MQIGQLRRQAIELAFDGRRVGRVVGASGVEQHTGGGFDAGVPQFGVIGVRLLKPSEGAAVVAVVKGKPAEVQRGQRVLAECSLRLTIPSRRSVAWFGGDN